MRTNVLQRSVGALDPCRAPPHGNLDASALLSGVPPCLPITLQRPDVSSCALTQAQSAFSLAINMRNQGAELGAPSVDENRSVFVTCAGNGARRGGRGDQVWGRADRSQSLALAALDAHSAPSSRCPRVADPSCALCFARESLSRPFGRGEASLWPHALGRSLWLMAWALL